MGMGNPPEWVGCLAYAETFHVEPERVNPKLLWWYRWQEWRYAQALRGARAAVEQYGLSKVTPETRKLYDELVLRYGRS